MHIRKTRILVKAVLEDRHEPRFLRVRIVADPVFRQENTGDVVFQVITEDVSFGYGDKEVLHHINLEFPEKSVTALVGPSGSGKSTVTRLIARFWDADSGDVLFGGVSVKAMSSLDPENEVLIQQAISALVEDKTVIVIAHRLQSICNADQIVVLEDGNITEKGDHESLLKKDGLYAKLWKEQKNLNVKKA